MNKKMTKKNWRKFASQTHTRGKHTKWKTTRKPSARVTWKEYKLISHSEHIHTLCQWIAKRTHLGKFCETTFFCRGKTIKSRLSSCKQKGKLKPFLSILKCLLGWFYKYLCNLLFRPIDVAKDEEEKYTNIRATKVFLFCLNWIKKIANKIPIATGKIYDKNK